MPELTGPLLAWLATYWIHSTLLLGACALLTWRLGVRRSATKERLWRVALLGGLLTATVQVRLGIEPLGGSLALDLTDRAAATTPAIEVQVAAPAAPTAAEPIVVYVTPPAVVDAAPLAATAAPAEPAPAVPAAGPPAWADWVVAAWALGGLLALARLALSFVRLRRHLAGRTDVRIGEMPRVLADLAESAGLRRAPRLTTSATLQSPVAKGILRREICVPARALSDLSESQQEAMLAHELAHLLRRDPVWLLVARIVEAALFFQPLNRLARKRTMELCELACDDWAVQRTGRPLALAHCLTEIADWLVQPRGTLPAVAMTNGSRLGSRIETLLSADGAPLWRPGGRGLKLALGALLLGVAVGAPGVAARTTVEPSEAEAEGRLELVDPAERRSIEFLPAEHATYRVNLLQLQPLVAGFLTVENDLVLLEGEVAEIRALLAELELEADFTGELTAVEQRLDELRNMRDQWAALLNHLLDSIEVPAGDPTDSQQHR